ncbi:hypothetical protein [Pedobacter hartonius]|uniref:Uncharacterized protein n=1 Tax=Pedobacter hartonius TaxID=425514 RepID=A0A1H4CLB2_9SPHI|nr:hypothetical protein [Pedobacter hartonius]SEA61147.1 hypothetical protein SAMN05443550_10493 [Pedobacter hartonius]
MEPHQVPATIEGTDVEIREVHFSSPFATLREQEHPSQLPAESKPKTELGNLRDVEFEPMIVAVPFKLKDDCQIKKTPVSINNTGVYIYLQ